MRPYLLLTLLLIMCCPAAHAQLSADTAHGNVVVREKDGKVTRALSLYKKTDSNRQVQYNAIYEPVSSGDEPDTLNFKEQTPAIKRLLAAAMAQRSGPLHSFSLYGGPYADLLRGLADIYAASNEWAAYLKQAGNLTHKIKLDNGETATEVRYNMDIALAVLDKSGYINQVNELLQPYGYTVSTCVFPDEHQAVLSPEQLAYLGKSIKLVVPLPVNSFILTKTGR